MSEDKKQGSSEYTLRTGCDGVSYSLKTEENIATFRAICSFVKRVQDVELLRAQVCHLAKACLLTSEDIERLRGGHAQRDADLTVKFGRTCGSVTPYDKEFEEAVEKLLDEAEDIGMRALDAIDYALPEAPRPDPEA